jgi:hypothetical protein
MHRAAQYVALAIIVGCATAVSTAQAADADNAHLVQATKLNEPAAVQSNASQPGESWRYRRHNGQWWYWMPSEKWLVWTGDRWTAYKAQAYSAHRAARPQRSSSYPADQGNWGPVRYNSYGQPQYPYSQRKSGLRQLGPVPAMGGVRSLPGWGGER